MRLRLVVPRYGETIVGGAETLIRDFATQLTLGGHDVAVLTTCAIDHFTWANQLPSGLATIAGVPVHRFPVSFRDESFMPRVQPVIDAGIPVDASIQERWVRNTGYSEQLMAAIDREADAGSLLLFAPYLFASTVYGARRRPERSVVIPCLHDEPYARFEPVQSTLRGALSLVFNSRGEQRLAERILGELPPHAVVGVGFDPPPVVDTGGFRQRHGLSRDAVIFVGRRERPKNFPLLMDWLHLYNRGLGECGPVDVVLMGGGEYVTPTGLAGCIHDFGFVDAQEKMDGLSSAVALVNLSVNESFSYVIMEAWLAGTPVIVSAGSAVLREHCEQSGGGLWVHDAEELAIAIDRLRTDHVLRRRLGERGRAYVTERYSWPAVISRLLAHLESLT